MDVCGHCFWKDYYHVLFYVFIKIVLYQRLLIIKVITSFNCLYVPDLWTSFKKKKAETNYE